MSAWRRVLAGLAMVRDAVLTAAALPFLLPLWCLPWNAATAVGRWYGYVVWAAWPRGRRIGMINLRRAKGVALSRREARESVRVVFGSLGQSIARAMGLDWKTARRAALNLLFPHACMSCRAAVGDSRPTRRSSFALGPNRSISARRRHTQLLWRPNNSPTST